MATKKFSFLVGALIPLLEMQAFIVQIVQSHQNGEGHSTLIGLQELRSYLRAFGYLNDDALRDSNVNTMTTGLEYALKMFQKNYNLNVTGKLDSKTIHRIHSPRCGVPDKIHGPNPEMGHGSYGSNGVGISPQYAFFGGNFKWPPTKYHLTYKFTDVSQSQVGVYALRDACIQAFGLWAKVSKFTFEQVGSDLPADLFISFQREEHGDGIPFDGPGKILAHAFAPMDGRVHVDADENWSLKPLSAGKFDLVWVAIHEIGHLLGLQHSTTPNAIMYPYVDPGMTKRALHTDDIAGIRALYSQP